MSLQQDNPTGGPPPVLERAIRKLLRPFVRLLLHYQVTYPAFTQWLKQIYVEVAEEYFALPNKKLTDSRVSLLTGVHRKDVRRIRHDPDAEAPPPAPISAQILAAWLSDPLYTNEAGDPLPLPKLRSQGDECSFEHLAESISRGDLRARAILDEWLRLGVVTITEGDHVQLNPENFLPAQNLDEKAISFGRNLHDHLAAAGENLMGREPPFFDRHVFYNNLTPASIVKLKAFCDESGMSYLKSVNRKAKALQRTDRRKEDATGRFNIGVFFYAQSAQIDAGPDSLDQNGVAPAASEAETQ